MLTLFIKKIALRFNIVDRPNNPIKTIDERLSTEQALRLENKNKKNIDELSAQILLQSYLDKMR